MERYRSRKDYRRICKMVTSETKQARLVYEQNLVEKAKQNPKVLYKYLNSQQAVKESIKALKKSNGELTQDPKEIANLLNKCFQDVLSLRKMAILHHLKSNLAISTLDLLTLIQAR